ncbi:hypothetical protein DFH09DRAFT_1019700 [Mycena vulgaris]|nr:hypothetical protein DFH09DRAFT_1019700 [Mycena vulgaris]
MSLMKSKPASAKAPSSTLPILDFPSEITSKIFVHSVEPKISPFGRRRDEVSQLSPYDLPLMFGCICRQWRSVAFSTPELWTEVQVRCDYFIEEDVPLLDRWLLRAGSLPLTIDIRYKVHPDTSSDGILELFKRHSHQLQNLTLDIPPIDLYRFAGIVGPLPRLAKLSLYSLILRPTLDHPRKISAFSIAPELRDVHFTTGFSPKNIDLPWEQLTTFRADTLPISQFLHVLSLCPNLVNCRYEIYHAATVALITVPPLLHLKSLEVRGIIPSTDILAQLTAPALVHLEVQDLALGRWAAFLSRSGCTLQYLAVATREWTPAMYVQGLERVPSVTELVLRRVGPSLYNLIALLKDRPHLLPNLKIFMEDWNYCFERLTLKNGADLCALVLDMLETRRSSPECAQLEKFEVCTTTGLVGSAELLGRLNGLAEGGMKICIDGSESWGRR